MNYGEDKQGSSPNAYFNRTIQVKSSFWHVTQVSITGTVLFADMAPNRNYSVLQMAHVIEAASKCVSIAATAKESHIPRTLLL
jgi:hypothetical protein